ncbi:uncharacterized protein LOC129347227 isoform X2 [Amphiprion ocellaris]|uniref:uncharacterized protein LOC111580143 isoform X2 n=2 Tax=Amphiprion ocellaris TaxID=80972 RepID=UPI002410D3E6|nr:uncharacterized protein LOC111580143 isoform X2 [Amphiprion ocellaris]XP_054860082.1 uncharacterized protein LOC129347249 isoform X2 [Amphiprion ocellaris]XP_054867020.1 uncharacterized protein LOC129347251 isoform X1 [Amphiprion ocellaris]XP_054871022.1 uncharacterized protein LOC111584630 isoform X2 [Amphiprion ocellaris]XP_054873810.1 uncharacterized protein LOC129347227 isoform X2 [Amphiprion ocellaris]
MVWLKKEEDIVVRRADKGGATVIWGKNDYIMEAQKQLNNRQYYVPLKSNPTENIKRDLFAILNPALENKWINKNEFEFLSPSNPKLATFYLLPKIHKNLHSPPGRPIINGIDTITEPASQYIDFVIKPLTMSLKAYLQDTTHILKDLQEMQQAPNAILATMDVESLYSNIDHQEGLEALEHFLQKRSNTETPPTQFVVSLTQWSLNNNIFLFQDRLYQQTKGTAMGASYAPNYAGLFLGLWEERYVHSTENPFKQLIKYYGRYIDDLFFIFTGTTEQLQEFHQYLNSTNPNIKLSLEFSNKEINFLDLLISLDEQGSIHTSLFRKSTDRNTVLHAESFHPKSLIENIPFGQFQRLKRICNSQTDFNTQATEMQQRFVQRGYKAKTLSGALTRAKTLDRRNLLIRRQRAPSQTKNRIFCTLQYSNMAYKIKNAITKNWSILACDPSLGPLFSEPPRFAFKKAPTLKDKIVKNYLPASKLETFFKKPIGTFRCGACVHCTQINRSTHFMDSTCTYTFKCRSFANCNTTHVVYRLDCVCGCFYIGRTKRKLKERFAEHKYAIRKGNMEYPIAKHFKNMTHTNINELTIMAIEVIENTPRGGDRLKRLLQRETFWIHSLKATVFPGLNEEIDFSPFL